MRTRIACTVLVWLASTTIGLADWSANQNQDLDLLVEDAQFFAPRDLSTFDTKPHANEGYFFTAHFLQYRVTSPRAAVIGNQDVAGALSLFERAGRVPENLLPLRIQENSIDTRYFQNETQRGQEFSGGFIEGGHGWMIRGFEMHGRRQNITATDVMMAFADPQDLLKLRYNVIERDVPAPPPPTPPFTFIEQRFLNLGIMFDELQVDLRTRFYSVEANYMHRHRLHYGDYLECFVGPRLLYFQERMGVRGYGGLLDDSMWDTNAHNYVVGPQIGLRWFKQVSSWQFAVEGRFTPAINIHETRQQVHLATQGGDRPFVIIDPFFPEVPVTRDQQQTYALESRSNDRAQSVRFSPIGELKFSASYILTRWCSVSAGYDFLYVGGLSRPTNMVDYTFPRMGIKRDAAAQDVFAHGLNLGIDFRR